MEENKTLRSALYLDDVRTPIETIPGYEDWVVVRNYDEFVEHITTHGIPDLISFDHDLADEHMQDYFDQVAKMGWQAPSYELYKEKTGLDCAKWLVSHIQDNPSLELRHCCVHSHNPVGAQNIQSFINGFKKHMGWEENCFMGRYKFTVDENS